MASGSTAVPVTPDPRSAWQPHGVHGESRWFDATAHTWRDATWAGPQQGEGVLGGVVYELHVGTFTPEGTLDAAQRRLQHLVDLGVDVVELMPVAAWPGRWNWGYDGVGPWAVDDEYDGPAALQRFVDACHRLGLGGLPRRGLQPPRSGGQLPVPLRAVLLRPPPDAVGPGAQPRRAGQPARAALDHRQRAALVRATSTSTPCGSTPCTSCTTTPVSTCWRSSPTRWRR